MTQESSSAHITARSLLSPTIQAWRIYLEDQGNSPHTVKAFTADLRLLSGYLAPDRAIGELSTTHLNTFLEWMQAGRGIACSPKTLSRRITSLKAFFRWLHQNGVILSDPAERVLQKSVLSPLPEVLTSNEVQAVLEAAEKHRRAAKADARPYTLVALLLETAIKKGECLLLSSNHIDLEATAGQSTGSTPRKDEVELIPSRPAATGPFLFVRYPSPQNRYKERKIAISEEWVAAYQEYQVQYDLSERLFPWSPRRLEYLLEDLGAEAGLSKHLSFDMCRWTSAVSDWLSGMEHDQIRQKLGVSKVQWREVSMKLHNLATASSG